MTSPDQLFVDGEGDVWLTAHPITHQYLRAVFDGYKSASQVLRIRFQGDSFGSWVITEPFVNNGTTFSAASAITLIDDYLLLGSRLEKALICRMNERLYV
jgi:hypothetical protein